MNVESENYIVYAMVDDKNNITAIHSSAFLINTDGWIEIDRGSEKKYRNAQSQYFPEYLYDDNGIYRYKLVNGKPVERTQAEMNADYVPYIPPVDPKELEIQELKQQVAALSAALLNL